MSSPDSGKQMSKNNADGPCFSSGSSLNNVPATMSSERHATHYNMNHKYRGIALIFNHEKFDKRLGNDLERKGTNKDADSMKNMLTELGFKVKLRKDNKLNTLKDNILKEVKFNHADYDCFVMVVLTHGKPKLFIIQACRGEKRMSSVTLEKQTEADEAFNTTYKIPSHADFLFAYSTIPGYISLRNETNGSWFIEALCKEFKSNKYNYDILSLLTFVIRRVAVDYEDYITKSPELGEQKQIPSVTTTLTRLVQFTEKSDECQALNRLSLK